MAIIINNNENKVTIKSVDMGNRVDHIPPMVYVVGYNELTGTIILNKDRKRFDAPDVIYGKKHKIHHDAIFGEFKTSDKPVGAILHGLKGAGKSMLSEALCNSALALDFPVFMVESEIPAHVISGLAKIANGAVFYFDEYAKVYRNHDVCQSMLTVFSDTSIRRTLFLVCDNNLSDFNQFIVNRPGRFLYSIEFKGIGADIVNELCDIYSIIDEIRTELLTYVSCNDVSMDVVKTLIRFAKLSDTKEAFFEHMSILNVPTQRYIKIKADRRYPTPGYMSGSMANVVLATGVVVDGDSVTFSVTEIKHKDGDIVSKEIVGTKVCSVKDIINYHEKNQPQWGGRNQASEFIIANVVFNVGFEASEVRQPDRYTVIDMEKECKEQFEAHTRSHSRPQFTQTQPRPRGIANV